MPAKLSVNLNAIAMLRNRRDLPWPSVVNFGRIALEAGAAGLTVHPRPDERHIRFTDVPALAARIPFLAEVSIGHGLTADALEYGMAETVRRYRRALGDTV